ncbi:ABC transporter ATP-binding protein [Paenibacillus koleovorans]|uniref:ABC transporter ATP-binding protein n=1 Tax=Paenibacillus koleovorans TaxID=121608 RepID=UPI00248291E9|nr:ABC transporter ATP-binding protein [Paenibacillus koleovorans]
MRDEKERTNRELFRRYLRFVKPYRYWIILIIVLGVAQFIVPLTTPWMTKIMLDQVLPGVQGAWSLTKVVGVLAILSVYGILINFIRNWVTARLGNRMVVDIRRQLYAHMQRLSQRYYDTRQVGGVVSRILHDVNGAQNLIGGGIINLIIDLFLVLFAGFMLFQLDTKLALLSLWLLPLHYLTFTNLNVRIRFAWRSVHRQHERMSGVLTERIAGMKVVQAFNREDLEMNRFNRQAGWQYQYAMRAHLLSNGLGRLSQTFNDAGGLIIWLVGGSLVLDKEMSIGGLIAFQAYLSQLYGPIQRFSEVNVTIQNSLANIERIFEVFDEEPEVASKPAAIRIPAECRGDIEFREVSFTYVTERMDTRARIGNWDPDRAPLQKPSKPFYFIPPRTRPEPPPMITEWSDALHRISFHARAGQVIAFVGPSGAGKSTIVNFIPRFYDPVHGAVLLDGIDLREYDVHDLRNQIALVLQDNILFSGTVYENIVYGRPEATPEEVYAAAHAAHAHSFIMEWEQGYETMLGERGVRLSGGQKQRLAIARALLKNPRILILDEATSALDAESEELVTQALELLMKGRTTFVIAHRLATVVRADQILVIDRGRIVENGSHQELLSQNGLYRELYEKQLKAMKPEELKLVGET